MGIVSGVQKSTFSSAATSEFSISSDIGNWLANQWYLYPPQAKDTTSFINHKVFFNPPDPEMPESARTTNVFSNETFQTWLYKAPIPLVFEVERIDTILLEERDTPHTFSSGIWIFFESNQTGRVDLAIDIDQNNSTEDIIDVRLSKFSEQGRDSVFWDGLNGLGENVEFDTSRSYLLNLFVQTGEIHIFHIDIENDLGGMKITRINGEGTPDDQFYYDHSRIGGIVSGMGVAGNARPTNIPFTYSGNFGNEKLLDYWTFASSKDLLTSINVKIN